MILEGIVTTVDTDGSVNIAPMGPLVPEGGDPWRTFVLRPFRSARTYANLRATGVGVLHITDDVLLLARAALGPVEPLPALVPAQTVSGWVLADACRFYEFRITECDDSSDRARFDAEVSHIGRRRDFFGFNRAKHAVLEAAILATRTALLPLEQIEEEYRRLAVLVDKTGGTQERQAFHLLCAHLERVREERKA